MFSSYKERHLYIKHGFEVYSYLKENFNILLYVGENCDTGQYSEPSHIGLRIDKYKSLGVEIADSKGHLLSLSEFNSNVCSKINQYRHNKYLTHHKYMKVPINLIEELLLENFNCNNTISSPQEIVGGNCCICNDYDHYAPMRNGKFYCYKHFCI